MDKIIIEQPIIDTNDAEILEFAEISSENVKEINETELENQDGSIFGKFKDAKISGGFMNVDNEKTVIVTESAEWI